MRKRFASTLLLLAAALAAAPAGAMTKCMGKDGKVIYTDGECDVGQRASGVAIHDSSGMDAPKRGLSSPSKASSSSSSPFATPKTANIPPPPTLNTKPIAPPPHLNDPNVNPGVRQHARWKYEEDKKAQAAENKQKMDDWKREVDRATK